MIALPHVTITPKGDDGGQLVVSGLVSGIGSGDVTATLKIQRSDGSGSSQTSQSRSLSVAPGSRGVVASTQLSVKDDFTLNATLTLTLGDATIGVTNTTLTNRPD
ncbi:curli-like amyloid fiber formation chaperone CsgH [Sulfitobacter sp. 915]|uniref:curli-like amyloid fiber formation chaperone CsgH n=1 Tax=Sulfitobacter sp. 915 TaxID=3368558 RepID=UPI0037462C05